MAIGKTVEHLKSLLMHIHHDLDKACGGNKAAAQRVRKNTIAFAKVAKTYRKESVAEGRKGKKRKTTARKKPVAKKKKAAPRRKVAARKKAPAKRKTTARRTVKRKTAKRRR